MESDLERGSVSQPSLPETHPAASLAEAEAAFRRAHPRYDDTTVLDELRRSAWGAFTRSHAAAASYSWIRPPSRSRRRMGVADAAGAPRVDGIVSGGSGARRSSARCGLCSL